MNKIKRGVSLLLCSLLFGSAVTLGNVADVQAGKQIKTETKQTINNTKTKKKVSDDQTSGKTGIFFCGKFIQPAVIFIGFLYNSFLNAVSGFRLH